MSQNQQSLRTSAPLETTNSSFTAASTFLGATCVSFEALATCRPGRERQISKLQALVFFAQNPTGTVTSLADLIGYSKRNTERIVAELKREGLLARTGSTRKGRWVVKRASR